MSSILEPNPREIPQKLAGSTDERQEFCPGNKNPRQNLRGHQFVSSACAGELPTTQLNH
jgi:hypothetical protein